MADSKIEWTGKTWNPTTGCDLISPGCGLPLPGADPNDPHGGCYACAMAARLKLMGQAKYQNDGDPRTSGPGFRLTIHPDTLDDPLRWRKPAKIFVNSMSDLFHDDVPTDFIEEVYATMAACPRHTFQVLTKRPQRMLEWYRPSVGPLKADGRRDPQFRAGMVAGAMQQRPSIRGLIPRLPMDEFWPLPNVWVGVSIETNSYRFRANYLRDTPAAVRFISAEPLLGPLPDLDLTGIDWLIAGGESGPGARPVHPDWIRDLRDRCVAAGVRFFFKQWGEYAPSASSGGTARNTQLSRHRFAHKTATFEPDGTVYDQTDPMSFARCAHMIRVGKDKAGRELDGRTWDEFPPERDMPAPPEVMVNVRSK